MAGSVYCMSKRNIEEVWKRRFEISYSSAHFAFTSFFIKFQNIRMNNIINILFFAFSLPSPSSLVLLSYSNSATMVT